MSKTIKVAVLGASGYTGEELVRLLALHPHVEMSALTADRRAGETYDKVYPHLGGLALPQLVTMDEVDYKSVDAVFCALPHGTTQEVIAKLFAEHDHLKVIDLSADFRLEDVNTYAQWYGHEHYAPHLQPHAVYGLTEWTRDQVRDARLAACPGCYPTGATLPLIPLLSAGAIADEDIIVDAKTGVTGAGRSPKEAFLFPEASDGLNAYGIATHRHAPEMEQTFAKVTGRTVPVIFTPHLAPMNRGILSTIYVKPTEGRGAAELRQILAEAYADEPFVRVLTAEQGAPATRHVRGSNFCLISVHDSRVPGRAIVVSAIDNLVKGSSGQAIQNFNLMFGIEETESLLQQPMFP